MTTETKPKLDDSGLDQWPPLAHIIRKKDIPVKKGTIALCGAKLMGIELPNPSKTCKKCIEIERKELLSS